jgi:hypothetical protein|tara:strand:+ start:4691 stop:4855 length:165 start_codon:yes stop_codon:yes gene_type:complete
MDFISSFFAWGKKPDDPVKLSKGRDKITKFIRPKEKSPTTEVINELDDTGSAEE